MILSINRKRQRCDYETAFSHELIKQWFEGFIEVENWTIVIPKIGQMSLMKATVTVTAAAIIPLTLTKPWSSRNPLLLLTLLAERKGQASPNTLSLLLALLTRHTLLPLLTLLLLLTRRSFRFALLCRLPFLQASRRRNPPT